MDAGLQCICGRQFPRESALTNHRRTCKKAKTRLGSALLAANDAGWTTVRKRPRLAEHPEDNLKMTIGPTAAEPEPNHQPTTLSGPNDTCPILPFDSVGSLQLSDRNAKDLEITMTTTPGPNPPAISSASSPTDLDFPIATRKPARTRIPPKRYRDILPEPTPFMIAPAQLLLEDDNLKSGSSGSSAPPLLRRFQTSRNIFGLSRIYVGLGPPSHDPELFLELNDVCESPDFIPETRSLHLAAPQCPPRPAAQDTPLSPLYPFTNESSMRLSHWFWCDGPQKSHRSFQNLLHIVGDPNFNPGDVRDAPWSRINKVLGGAFDESTEEPEWEDQSRWKQAFVTIRVPFQSNWATPGPKEYTSPHSFHYRSIISILREKVSNPVDFQHFHCEPFELYWKPSEEIGTVRVYGELYSSPEFLDAHRALQESPGERECNRPRVIAALMFWSDGTELTSFGTAKLWPCYMGFGNESKYRRCRPALHLMNHIAYFQSLPDEFKDWAANRAGRKGLPNAFFTHCRREFLHAQWETILDTEFLEAYEHGLIIRCPDSIERRFYPRIFTYSADYKEKVIIACIRDLGNCPCPRCLIPLSRVHNLGMPLDRTQRRTQQRIDNAHCKGLVMSARRLVYEENHPLTSVHIEKLLKGQSLVPTENAFSRRLGSQGFDMYKMFVNDFLHEWSQGTWRSTFVHLLRILHVADTGLVHELDQRYRKIPTFGRETIRRFSKNVSELKKVTAHDFDDLLICAVPAFEQLLPEPHNTIIVDLLLVMAQWHGLAKLRLHTDQTLAELDNTTTKLGMQLRLFRDKTCSAFQTRELPREAAARRRRATTAKEQKSGKGGARKGKGKLHRDGGGQGVGLQTGVAENSEEKGERRNKIDGTDSPTPKLKAFNMNTFKTHAHGDVAETIRRFGTTDLYSTEPGELEHRTSKARFTRTDRKTYEAQMAKIERRESRLTRLRSCLPEDRKRAMRDDNNATARRPESHHHMGKSQNEFEDIGIFIRNGANPATKASTFLIWHHYFWDFVPKLMNHLLPRVKALLISDQERRHLLQTDDHRDQLLFKNNRLYIHRIFRVNYTTYDLRRAQDVINPNTSHADIMVMSDTNVPIEVGTAGHRFRYARVLGIFHVNVFYANATGIVDCQPLRMEFLWVRWFRVVDSTLRQKGSAHSDSQIQFPQLEFTPTPGGDAFGFIDPVDVMRGCHIVPCLALGKKGGLDSEAADWQMYYANCFVDRDMLMRYYWGFGVGHIYAHGDEQRNTLNNSLRIKAVGSLSSEPSDKSVQIDLHFDASEEVELNEASGSERSDVDEDGLDYIVSEDSDSELSNDSTFIEMEDMYYS